MLIIKILILIEFKDQNCYCWQILLIDKSTKLFDKDVDTQLKVNQEHPKIDIKKKNLE